ncbi:MAG: hypothetical protein ABL308_13345 [Oceanicaulis sp.]
MANDRFLDRHGIASPPHPARERLAALVVTEPAAALAVLRDRRLINSMSVSDQIGRVAANTESLLATVDATPLPQTRPEDHTKRKRVLVALIKALETGFDARRANALFDAALAPFDGAARFDAAADALQPAVSRVLFDLLRIEHPDPAGVMRHTAAYMLNCHPIGARRNLETIADADAAIFSAMREPVRRAWLEGEGGDAPIVHTARGLAAGEADPLELLTRATTGVLLGMDQLLNAYVHVVFAAMSASGDARDAFFDAERLSADIDQVLTRCSSGRYVFRKALEDCEFEGRRVAAGAHVCIDIAAQPREDVDYRPMAFAGGRHKCPGEALTMKMLRATLPGVVARFSDCRPVETTWKFGVFSRCIEHLEVVRDR